MLGVGTDAALRLLGVTSLPGEETGAFQTLGGFVLHRLQRMPREGERFAWNGFGFEVADADRQRIDRILIQRLPPVPALLSP
jgi:putative hemolysin